MHNQIKAKNEQFRKNIRRKELQAYFQQKRQQLMQVQSNPDSLRLHEQIKEHIGNGNISEIYRLLYKTQSQQKLKSIPKPLCFQVFNLLIKHISQIESALLLKVLIDVKYRMIFLDRELQSTNIHTVDVFYKNIDEKVHQLSLNQDQASKKQIMKYINSYLDCIRSLINNKQERQGDYIFNYAFHPQNIQKLWQYFGHLHMNPFYLLILSLAEIDLSITSLSNKVQQILINNAPAVQKLILQIDSDNNSSKNTFLPSLMLANEIVRNLQYNKQFIIHVLPVYLRMLKCAHSQQLNNKTLEGDYFYDMLENTMSIFEQLSQELMPIHLGELMSKSNLWTFFYLFLRISGKNRARWQVYQIIKLAINNILVNKAPLKDYITETLISFLVEGTESVSIEVVAPSLEAIQLLVHHSSRLNEEFFEWLNSYEIDNILENLEYSKTKQIAEMASYLRKRLQHLRESGGNQMSDEYF